ncbi:MAG TPA: BON domain-containing protein [Rubrobacter sp.]|nr:BON domain-containing protein [Rubrobacter sp.]
MARKKRRAAKVGSKAGARVAPVAGRAAWKLGKAEAKLIRRAMSPQEPKKTRYLKYGFFILIGLAIGAAIARSKKGETSGESSSYTGTTGPHAPDPGSPAGERGQTWGSGTPTGTAGGGGQQSPEGANRTGAEREYSDPASGPLIGEQHSDVEGVGAQQEEIEQRIRTQIGEDPRTAEMPRVNVEVNDGIAELRGSAPSEDAKQAAGEIAQQVEGVREVRNLIQVS